ncbi:hypothetical protein EYC80_009993 [Monilinia laxa]|uniref:Uncharacterized protein n=1 Tax=Monilinia laxa TaxID=61186 RepID=A0A5N6JRA1_MONLA|nr:hypothetical protein EYC80_009993 [Monilinia laxa]
MVVTLPSPDTYVRFVSKRTGKVLADDDELYHTDKDPAKAEHWWRIIPTNGQTDRYIIKNVTTGRAIWCRFKNRRAGCIDDDGKWADNWFVFEETKLPGCSGTFRIRCPSTNCTLASRTDQKPAVDGIMLKDDGSPDNEDQHFSMIFEDMEVQSIEYDIKAEQIQTFTYNEDKAEEHSFEHSHGFEVSFSQKITINVLPMVAGGEFEVKASQKNEWKWGEKNTITTKWGISQALKVPKNSTFVATLTATKKEISVPFKITWVAKDSGAKNITYGVYKGVSYYGASTSVKPKSGTSGTAYKDEKRSLENDSEGTEGGTVYEERTYQENNEQADFSSAYREETTYNSEYSYYGQGSYKEGQAYNNDAEKEDEHQAEPEYEENKPYEEFHDGEESHQSNEIDYDEQGSWKQDNEDEEPYHTEYQQNESEETGTQEQSSSEAEAEETTLQSTYVQDSYGNGNSYEDRQYDSPQVGNLSLEDSVTTYQASTGSYSRSYSQQNPYNNGCESNQLNNDFTNSGSYTSKYQDTSRSREDDSSNEQRYSEGDNNNNAYGQTNEYDEPSRPTYQDKNYDETRGYGQPSKPTYEENTCGQANDYERTSEDATIELNSYGSTNPYDRNSNYDRYPKSTYGGDAESSDNSYQQY